MENGIKRFMLYMPLNLHKQLKTTVVIQGKTMTDYIIEAIEHKLKTEEQKP